jgi:hypothetical protein
MTTKDAAADRRRQLAAQLLRGESVIVTQQGELRPLSERGGAEVAITVPEGKLASPSLYWYERDAELFAAELEAMNHFFPQFRPDRLPDGRMSWLGSLASGIPGSQRIWHLQLVYDHDHPHQLGECIPHTLRDEGSGELSICTVDEGSFKAGDNHCSTAASSLAWAAKWIVAFELWMLGEINTAQFAGHRI